MRLATTLALTSALAGSTTAHYVMGRLILDGKWTNTWEYVREVSPKENTSAGLALVSPNIDPTSPDIRCGRNATLGWSKPKVAIVKAGDTIGFGAGEPKLEGTDAPRLYHPGFGSAWLSKYEGEGSLDEYDGSGEWVKILQIVNRTEQSVDFDLPENKPYYDKLKAIWGTFRVDSWNFTIPATTPPDVYFSSYDYALDPTKIFVPPEPQVWTG
ncbi:hypothetical protein EJ04DRAFT_580177 [Polyplosphaeria fusca]|uniref:lytic cellulose monooxygenase (C4-dehydrogenating) n=1 Tax=Polyplosphaeria fusca TaxID=682080 RepID=A0A9P4QMG7_9PLEO|nr:hypothetical protein EJ04DRAFT_580177 [Polyplosphaeria fusca]